MNVSFEATHEDFRCAVEPSSGGVIDAVVSAFVHYIRGVWKMSHSGSTIERWR